MIDTNVLLVANAQHADASPDCVTECIRRLKEIQANGVAVIDDAFHILSEYQNKTELFPAKGVGDIFLKWLLRNAGNPAHVEQVTITETAENEFLEFPDGALQSTFDAPDRKFVAVANAHADKPPVWQAVDCKWLSWWQSLQAHGISVHFLCLEDVCRFHKKKFPKSALPQLPTQ